MSSGIGFWFPAVTLLSLPICVLVLEQVFCTERALPFFRFGAGLSSKGLTAEVIARGNRGCTDSELFSIGFNLEGRGLFVCPGPSTRSTSTCLTNSGSGCEVGADNIGLIRCERVVGDVNIGGTDTRCVGSCDIDMLCISGEIVDDDVEFG